MALYIGSNLGVYCISQDGTPVLQDAAPVLQDAVSQQVIPSSHQGRVFQGAEWDQEWILSLTTINKQRGSWFKPPVSYQNHSYKVTQSCQMKKNIQPKSCKLCFARGPCWEDHSLSDSLEELLQRGKRGSRIYRRFCWNKRVVKHLKMTINHRKQASQVHGFSAFLCMERCKGLGSWKLFLMLVNCLGPRTVRPLKMAVFLLSVHLMLDQTLLHSRDYPILLITGLNQ